MLVAYFQTGGAALEARLAEALAGVAGATFQSVAVADVDWVSRFRGGFTAFDVGPFRIVPSWEAAPSPAASDLVVDPGRAFGTGTHESTQLALLAIAGFSPTPARVLDVGTGSGLLAVAALRRGARFALGSDVDTEALASARFHARLNAVDLHLVQADGGAPFREGAFDLVLANLSAGLLREHAAGIVAAAAPGGWLVLSGLLADDVADVRAAHPAFASLAARERGEWAALVGRREARP